MSGHCQHQISRRAFLEAAVVATVAGGCTPTGRAQAPTDRQRAWRRQGSSTVAIARCESYEEDVIKLVKAHLDELSLPDLKGKRVLIKPNMVEFHPDKPIHTNPRMIETAVELVDALGAREIIIGEGPGHVRDTEFLLSATGIGAICSKLGVPFVDLNLDQLEAIDNPDGFTRQGRFFLPRTAVEADAVVSLPKLKTHHWMGMTASMKNLFGVVPGRKYGWPKNVLHVDGIVNSIMDVMHLVRPSFAVVDAVVAMEGDGPVNGTARQSSFVVVGSDLAAVDATCARAIDIRPQDLPYMELAGQVLGNTDEADITIVGTPVAQVRQPFTMPVTFKEKNMAQQAAQQAS